MNDYIIITDDKKKKKIFYDLKELINYLDSFKMSFLPDGFKYKLKKKDNNETKNILRLHDKRTSDKRISIFITR